VCPERIDDIWEYTQENLASGRLYYDDAIIVSYLSLRINGTSKYRNIKQVVIDEAQDYYPLQFDIFRLLFPNGKFTVLGDINQTLAKQEDMTLYDQIKRRLNKKKASLITLEKSFRCTNEILQFSMGFMSQRPEIESFNRKGDKPEVIEADTHEACLAAILQEIEAGKQKGFKNICLICKTERNVVRLFEEIKHKTDIRRIKAREADTLEGVFIMPVYLSKGLEFDMVIICDADFENYCGEDDRKLLYVACTRALHRLSLICEGNLSLLSCFPDSGILPYSKRHK